MDSMSAKPPQVKTSTQQSSSLCTDRNLSRSARIMFITRGMFQTEARLVPVLSRCASTEVVKKPRKAAAPPVPKSKALKSPSSRSSVSAFTLFMQKFALERKQSGEKFLLQNAADAYKQLPDSEKSKLLEQIPEAVSQRKAIYDEFLGKLSPADIVAENKTRAKLRRERIAAGKSVRNLSPILDQNAPTRPSGSFILWANEARKQAEYDGMTVTEQARSLGEKWKALADSERAEFNAKAKQMKDEYEKKKAEYYGSS